MNGKRNIKHNESASVRFLMTVICVIAVIMVTVYFIGAQFRPDTDGELSDDTGIQVDGTGGDDGVTMAGPRDELIADTDFTVYISLTFTSSAEASPGTTGGDVPSNGGQIPENTDVPDGSGDETPPENGADTENRPDVAEDYPEIVICDHKWRDATCSFPAMCRLCGMEGAHALGHDYSVATCTDAAVCVRCGAVSEKALGHDWSGATCTEAKVCRRCGVTGGDPLGHKWQDATCAKPETCSRCGETRGEALEHKWRDATCTDPEKCSRCGKTRGEPAGHKWRDATTTSPRKCSVCGAKKGDRLPNPIKVSAFSYTDEELDMLARLIYLEAGTKSYDGMLAVATVVMNRVRSSNFGNSIVSVITAPGQFTTKEKLDSVNAPESCYRAARECLGGDLYDRDILFFKAASGGTGWGGRTYCFSVGNNYFYT